MAVVSFDMTFSYVAAGWEGSASDQAVLRWTVTSGRFVVPEGNIIEIHEFFMHASILYIHCVKHILEKMSVLLNFA
jgi:hypothetical protein